MTEVNSQTPKKNPEFAVHMLNEDGKGKARAISQAFDGLLNSLESHCVPGREWSLRNILSEDRVLALCKLLRGMDEFMRDHDLEALEPDTYAKFQRGPVVEEDSQG